MKWTPGWERDKAILTFLKVLLSLAIEIVCAFAGGFLAAGLAYGSLRSDEMGPGAGVTVVLFGLVGFAFGSFVGAAGIVMLWRRTNTPRQLFPGQGGNLEGVWPPPPRR